MHLQVNTLNVEGRTVQRINGRKMYKAKKFPDYKKAYVKVGPSPANVDSNEVDSEEWQGFMVPVRTSGGVGAQAMPRVEKYKMNQQTHWLNRLPLAEAEDEDEEGKRYDEVVAGTATAQFQPNRRETGHFGKVTHAAHLRRSMLWCSCLHYAPNHVRCQTLTGVGMDFCGALQLEVGRSHAAKVARAKPAEDIPDQHVTTRNEMWWSDMCSCHSKPKALFIHALFAARHTSWIGPFVPFVPLRSQNTHGGSHPNRQGFQRAERRN